MTTELPVSVSAFREDPVDEVSRGRLATIGLDLRLIDDDGYAGWLQGVARGFLDGERSDEQIATSRDRSGHRRLTGVFDAGSPLADVPVGTIASWAGRLSVPGGRDIPSCAISAVTVSPTHRRRGVARAMLEGELRAAHAAGLPAAMLTVSESTLYGRYGFAPAALAASWRIDVKRASWIGPQPGGRVDFVSREDARTLLESIHARARLGVPGEADVSPGTWDQFTGTTPTSENPGATRAIRYADDDAEVRGVAVYTVRENDADVTRSSVTITYLLAETDDAYAALWRFFVELDLIGEVSAGALSVDEPLRWMLSDQRAATVTVTDHQYVRVLDVKAALEARVFGADGTIVLDVSDPLGFVAGRWLLEVADGVGAVSALDGDAPDGAVEVSLGVEELSAVYLGGVSLATLAAAGRVKTPDAATARVFGWHIAPRLSFWY
ncbi:GNAT family N-acetyltransferase [Planococcus sp. APC 4015]|nr:GNAT family N-acetyltransferase [Planococcus sp. APC 4015]